MPVCGENSSEHNSEHAKSDAPPTHVQRVGSAMFYAISSILIVFVNKSVLTVYEFPSPQVLGMGQMTAACVVLGALKALGKIDFPDLNKDTPRKIFPLPLLYLLNLVFGLKSTKVFQIRLKPKIYNQSTKEPLTANVHRVAAVLHSTHHDPRKVHFGLETNQTNCHVGVDYDLWRVSRRIKRSRL